MTAVLSPAETDEVTRFGIHDDEAFAEIIEHADDALKCGACECAANFRVILRCCGRGGQFCVWCLIAHRVAFEERARFAETSECLNCGHSYGARPAWRDAFREVPL